MTDLRLGAGILAGRFTGALIRLLRAGGGTTMPGRAARLFAPDLLARLGRAFPQGTVLITGTNGKTTTARLLTAVLARAGWRAVHNRAGANLAAGIETALLARSTVGGRVDGDVGVFEVDEATLPLVVDPLRPRVLLLGNLFRDQLDRYGEIDLVADRWRAALARLPADAVVIYNGDDPLVADVARDHPGSRPFGIADSAARRGEALEHAADGRYCYRCGVPYRYAAVYLGHLGEYTCPRCAAARPPLAVAAQGIALGGIAGLGFTLTSPAGLVVIEVTLPGLYNVYNVLAAAAAALALGVSGETIAATTREFRPAFGRGERIQIDGHPVFMLLAKNPAGFNEVLRTVTANGRLLVAVIAINDRTADGRDISWLWDVDFELLRGACRVAVVTGRRAHDMAVRLKYAGLPGDAIRLAPDLAQAILLGVGALAPAEPLYVLPTYTAMLEIRDLWARRGYVRAFWED